MDRNIQLEHLRFRSPIQHSPGLLVKLSDKLKQESIDLREVLTVANQLTINAHPAARSFLRALKNKILHPDAQSRFDKLLNLCDQTERLVALPAMRHDPHWIRSLYALDNYVFMEGDSARNKLAVVFTTVFNNFGISNLVLLAILKQFGVSVLLLKDSTLANYLGGAHQFGNNLDEVADNIRAFAAQRSCDHIYLMGYSSGGYASCYVSARLKCEGFLGLSFPADFSLDTALPTDWFIKKPVRELFDQRFLVDLASLHDQEPVRRRLIIGAKSQRDRTHAHHLRDNAGFDVIEVEECFHDTPETLMARGEFKQHLDWLFGEAV